MAFLSQLYLAHNCLEGNQGILLVRPMLAFSKDDIYKICEGMHQQWVEDPTNQRPLFARNRLRIALKSLSTSEFRSEMQSLITACRLTRSFVQNVCYKMIEGCVSITDHGYATIDLEKLDPSNVEDLCLTKFLAIILQFISQRQRPVRGSVSQLLLKYVRTLPCKTSLTAAGCYLCAAPRSKGTKVLVCFHDSPQPTGMPSSEIYSGSKQHHLLREIEHIIVNAKSYAEKFVLEATILPFLHTKSCKDVLNEAKKLNLVSDSTYSSIVSLQVEEHEHFSSKKDVEPSSECRNEKASACSSRIELHYGESCHFMSRFLVTWEVCRDALKDGCSLTSNDLCQFCTGGQLNSVAIRNMVDSDWLYLAKVSKEYVDDIATMKLHCLSYMQLSAHKALKALKSIPVSARRALPVIVSSQDLPLSIPTICFSCCPQLLVTTVFKPRVPIGGGYSSYI